MHTITADRHSLVINGERTFLISGAVHYPRSTPGMWPHILRHSKALGLNCIETYVFWEGHEPEEGCYDFTGRYDLGHFLDLCQAEGLYVILRIGPYVCSEWSFGGLPWWLITTEGMVTRTENAPFMAAMGRWVRVLLEQIGDRQFTQGGPIILAQMENEYANVAERYGEAGQRYLAWATQLGRDAGIEVPLIMCEGASDEVIETLNGFSVWQRVAKLHAERPNQPALWTENWPGWYNVWCQPRRERTAEEIAYEILRFVAVGGSGVNYYMWHGGTNFARDAMFLQTTAYDFGGPLDEYGLPSTKGLHLAQLHTFLQEHKAQLLMADRRPAEMLIAGDTGDEADSAVRYAIGTGMDILVNATHAAQQVDGLAMPARSALARVGGEVAYRSWETPAAPIVRTMLPADLPLQWQMLEEPLPGMAADAQRRFTPVTLPHNLLLETRDTTDYGWYSTTVTSPQACTVCLTTSVADLLSVWVNGRYIGSTPDCLEEDRPRREQFAVQMDIPLEAGENEVILLVTALGLIKGDWMIGAPQSEEQKGLLAPVLLDGRPVDGPWTFAAGAWGERVGLPQPGPATLAPWDAVSPTAMPLRWYRAVINLTADDLADSRPWALEIGDLFRGTLWLNGHGIGRYWQQPSPLEVEDCPWHAGHIHLVNHGAPPQRYYHLPLDWLQVGENTLILLEERGALPDACRVVRQQ